MRSTPRQSQQGYVLILTLIAFMGIGGVVLAGYTQQARDDLLAQQARHNQEVLAEAKQALLMYAYNYPANNPGVGPGRLPCPDQDDDANGLPGRVGFPLDTNDCETVGRLPWGAPGLEFYDARDATGERLWYAVSDSFYNLGGGPDINSNSAGQITLYDQSGGVVYDSAAGEGIAAVIFAPGAVIRRDNDNDGSYEFTQLRATGLQQIDPRNYLDTVSVPAAPNAFDNSVYTLGESDTNDDGFIPGPVFDPAISDFVVNDQLIVITADEVIEVAKQATLKAYHDAIENYRANTGGIYPWLDDYVTNDITRFDADFNIFKGRLPSLFGDYFSNANPTATRQIISDLRLTLRIDDLTISRTFAASASPDISFDAVGDLVTNFSPPDSRTYYFWDGHPTSLPTLAMDGTYELCPGTIGNEEDCNMDISGNWKGPASTSSDVWLQVRRVTVTYNSIDDPFEFLNSDLIATAATYTPAGAGTQAYVFRDYNNNSGYLTVFQEYDQDFQDSFDIQSSGNLVFDGADRLTVGLIYYPELPIWAIDDEWHHSVQVTLAEDYKPDGNNTDCTVNGCLVVNNLAQPNNDKISLLVIADRIDDVDESADGFLDDLVGQFEAENDISNLVYDRIAGNDRVRIVQ